VFNNYTDLQPTVSVPQTAIVGRTSAINLNFTNIAVTKKAKLVVYMGGVMQRSTLINEKTAGQTFIRVEGVGVVTGDIVYELSYV
jgi:hypothetical protein